jgi:hypothetical protein
MLRMIGWYIWFPAFDSISIWYALNSRVALHQFHLNTFVFLQIISFFLTDRGRKIPMNQFTFERVNLMLNFCVLFFISKII